MDYGKEINQTFQGGFDLVQMLMFAGEKAIAFVLAYPVLFGLVIILVLTGGKSGLKLGKFFDVKLG